MSVRTHVTKSAGALIAGFIIAGVSPAPAAAQRDGALRSSLELRPVVGAFIPTGREHRNFVKDSWLLGAQASWEFSQNLAATGNFAWAPSESRRSFFFEDEHRLNVYQYDVGVEGRTDRSLLGVGGFGGVGIGGRTYHMRDVGTRTNLDGYFALGGEYRLGRTAVRIEGRDYISQFRPFDREERRERRDHRTRNDVTLSAGVTFRM